MSRPITKELPRPSSILDKQLLSKRRVVEVVDSARDRGSITWIDPPLPIVSNREKITVGSPVVSEVPADIGQGLVFVATTKKQLGGT